jgi:hypothetical protein
MAFGISSVRFALVDEKINTFLKISSDAQGFEEERVAFR